MCLRDDLSFQQAAGGLMVDIMGGHSLSSAMARQPHNFSSSCCSLVEAGEMSGGIHRTLERLGKAQEKCLALLRKLQGALIYPTVLAIACGLMVILILYFVFPMVIEVTAQNGAELPVLSKILIKLSSPTLLVSGVSVALLLANALFLILRHPVYSPAFRRFLETWTLPGRMFAQYQVSEALREIADMLEVGIDLCKALSLASQISQKSILVSTSLESIRRMVSEGEQLSDAVSTYSIYPRYVSSLIASAEEGGVLPASIILAAEMLEDELDSRITLVSNLIEPMLMGTAGIAVGIVILGSFLPIYNLIAF